VSDRVVILGPGRIGLALGAALLGARALESLHYIGRSHEPPPHPVFEAGGSGAGYLPGPHPLPEGTTVAILAVPDSALPEVAHDLARAGPAPAGCAALHVSGALSGDILAPLHAAGYAIGSLHPLQTVADAWSAAERLVGASFAVSGEPVAIAAARRLVSALEGTPLVIAPAFRATYHAAAVFASNYVVALASVAARMLRSAGVPEELALPALLPLLRGTIQNLEHLGPTSALTGPIVRGDIDTVRLHLARLSGEERALYCALGRETLRLARQAGLDEERAAALDSLLAQG
jgi:predicted short-subunit dehydrogenase-like oxidoreductase (DUF2520 family)